MNKVLGNKKAISLFVVPALIIYTIIVMVPVIWSLYYSFFSGSPGLQWEFAGFDNYARLFRDKNFLNALTVNCKYVLVVTVGQVGMGLLLSLMFKFWLRRCKTIVRTLVFFPVVLPTVAVGQLFAKIYEIQPNYGLLNSLLDSLGFTNLVQPWIGQSSTALWALCVMDIWVAMGFYSVIFYGALLDISDDILVMYLGCMVEKSEAKDLFQNQLHPYTKGLMSAIPIPDITVPRKPVMLQGELSSPINPKPGCRFANRCSYAKERCFQEQPALKEELPGHFVACHYCREINNLPNP